MTFHSIIYGVLFLGSIHTVFTCMSGGEREFPYLQFLESMTLTVAICGDVLYTSHIIEDMKKSYLIGMKILDLICSLVLIFALLIVDRTVLSTMNVSTPDLAATLGAPRFQAWFWTCMGLYWVTSCWWAQEAEVWHKKPPTPRKSRSVRVLLKRPSWLWPSFESGVDTLVLLWEDLCHSVRLLLNPSTSFALYYGMAVHAAAVVFVLRKASPVTVASVMLAIYIVDFMVSAAFLDPPRRTPARLESTEAAISTASEA